MNDEPTTPDDIDHAASEALDAALVGGPPLDQPDPVLNRLGRLESVRAMLRDDRDAPSPADLNRLVETAMAAMLDARHSNVENALGPVPVASLEAHRARRVRSILAAAAAVVLLTGTGWYLTRPTNSVESAQDTASGADAGRSDAEPGGSGSETDFMSPTPPPDAAPTTTAPAPPGSLLEGVSGDESASEEPAQGSGAVGAGEGGSAQKSTVDLWRVLLEWLSGGNAP